MRRIRKDFLIYFAICIVLLVVGSIFDLTISSALYNRTSLISRVIHIIAQIPTYILLVFFSMGIFNSRNRDGSIESILSCFFGFVGAIVFGFLAGYVFLYNLDLYSITLIAATDVGIYVCCYIITKLICDHNAAELRKFSKIGLYSFIICMIIGFILITIFNRVTYRRLDGMVNVFMPWYQPEILLSLSGYLHRSFPSMIVLVSSFVLYVNMFNNFSRLFNKRKVITMILGYSWVFIVAISQLILGYAYLSDIAISLLLEAFVSILMYIIVTRKRKQVEN